MRACNTDTKKHHRYLLLLHVCERIELHRGIRIQTGDGRAEASDIKPES